MLALAISFVGQILFVVPGVLIARAVAGSRAGWLAPITFGPLVGHALCSLALVGVWTLGGRGPWALAVASAIAAALIVPARHLEGRWRLPAITSGDVTALVALWLLVIAIVALPFLHVAEPVSDGTAYRAYFTADYVWRRAVVAELAKGDFLPVNPFYAGDTLRYYWLPHLLNAVQYRSGAHLVTLDAILVWQSVFIDLFFAAFLYGVVRLFGIRPLPAAAGVASIIVCSSYEGAWVALNYAMQGTPLREVRNLNIDAISRWYYGGMPIDGLQRVLFYQPHHATAYAIGFLGVSDRFASGANI